MDICWFAKSGGDCKECIIFARLIKEAEESGYPEGRYMFRESCHETAHCLEIRYVDKRHKLKVFSYRPDMGVNWCAKPSSPEQHAFQGLTWIVLSPSLKEKFLAGEIEGVETADEYISYCKDKYRSTTKSAAKLS